MNKLEYWQECIADAAAECGLTLTHEQLHCISASVEGAHDNIGMAFHQPESPYPAEIKKLTKALETEKRKITCPECRGSGRITTYGGTMQCTSECWKCLGEGKRLP